MSTPARATGPVGLVIVKEHGGGTASSAQGHVDRLVKVVAKENGWDHAIGKYLTRRDRAEVWIAEVTPHYGILSLAAFLAMRGPQGLEILGRAVVKRAGGHQYHLVSTRAKNLQGCKGKTMVSDHADDPRFIDTVVAKGSFMLADFELIRSRRPMQTVKKVLRGEAECALIDDAQFSVLHKIDGGKNLKSVWKSDVLPSMVVVAFPAASAREKQQFRSKLNAVCTGAGKAICKEVGIAQLESVASKEYRDVIRAYGG